MENLRKTYGISVHQFGRHYEIVLKMKIIILISILTKFIVASGGAFFRMFRKLSDCTKMNGRIKKVFGLNRSNFDFSFFYWSQRMNAPMRDLRKNAPDILLQGSWLMQCQYLSVFLGSMSV